MAAGAAREPERVAFVLIDGVGDVTVPALGGRTPLQAAALPHLDAVAGAPRQLRLPCDARSKLVHTCAAPAGTPRASSMHTRSALPFKPCSRWVDGAHGSGRTRAGLRLRHRPPVPVWVRPPHVLPRAWSL